MLQLEYEKRINDNLRNIINNDSIAIRNYTILNEKLSEDYKKAIRQRNIAIGVGVLFFASSLLIFLK